MSTARLGLAFLLAILAFSVATSAHAAPKDAAAQKLVKQAMDVDYLDTNFDDAEKKIRSALETCGDSGCSNPVKAKAFIALGVVLGGGKGKKDEAKKAFVDALKLDKKAAPDPDYVTAEIDAIFADAKKAAASGGGDDGGSGGDGGASEGPLSLTPIGQQKVNTPVPIYVSMDEDTAKKVTSMTLYYRGVGGGDTKEIELEKSGKAYRGNVPCGDVAKKGELKLWIVARDKKSKEVATLGSEGDPLVTKMVADLDGKPPSWPGFAPPDQCAGGGGDGGGDDGPKEDTSGSSHRQCVDTSDCPEGEQCSGNECLKKASSSEDVGTGDDDKDGGPSDDARKNWFTLTFSPDFPMISGENICGFKDAYGGGTPSEAYDATFICARNADSENPPRYLGQPTLGQGNNVNFGFGLSTLRLMLGYDRVLIAGLSAGARVGYVFNGTSLDWASFIPVHAEGRLTYTIGENAFTTAVVRPWVFLNGGLAQVDTAVNVDVLEDGDACGAADASNPQSECTAETADGTVQPRVQTLKAIKQAGLGFVGGGLGVSFLPAPLFAINVGLKFSVTVPVVVPVLSPEAGIGIGF